MKKVFLHKVFCRFGILVLTVFFSGLLSAQINLQTPQIDSITVNSQGFPLITWFPNTDNTQGYVIVKKQGFTWQILDTVPGIQQTSYTDLSGEPCIKPEWYRIYAFFSDPINFQQANSPWSDTLRTILLNPPVLNVCENTVTLSWNDYINMIGGLSGYEVYASTDGTNFQLLGVTSPEQTSFVHQNPLPDQLYSYKVTATNVGRTRTSSSCIRTLPTRTYPKPSFLNIISASVEDNSFVRITWEADTLAPILQYEISRRPDNQPNFSIIGSNRDNQNFKPERSFDDQTADFRARSLYYQIIMYDSCGNQPWPQSFSTVHRTIFLTGQWGQNYNLQLFWNHYEGWQDGVDRYDIFRSIDGQMFSLLASVPGTQNNFTDDISGFSQIVGTITYYISGQEKLGNQASSNSNYLTVNLQTDLQVPNAFIPDAPPPDNEFKPLISFYRPGSYHLQIFNKWGEMIFETRDVSKGWDGKKDGAYAPSGAYVYLIRFITPEGQAMEKRGTVTLIR